MEHDNRAYVLVPKRGAHPYGDGFVQINQSALMKLATDRTLGMQATRVFWAMLATMNYENRIMADAKSLGEILGMSVPNVYSAMNELKKAGLIEHHPTMRRDWRINLLVAWKGSVRALKDALRREAA